MLFPRITFAPKSGDGKDPTREDRRDNEQTILTFWTNFSLVVAVVLGVAVAWAHGSVITASITAFAGAVGLGGVLGFLFGVPSPKTAANKEIADNATVSTGDRSTVNVGTVSTPPAPSLQNAGTGTQSLQPQGGAVTLTAGANPQGHPADASASSTHLAGPRPRGTVTSAAPSNLEQVADWVTKLLLGGGLTQISKIPPKVWEWSRAVAVGILGDDANPAHVPATQAFAAGLLVYGFVLGFFGGFLITKLQLGKAISS
jgi:hypothetical protein